MYNKVPFKRGVAIREDRGTFKKKIAINKRKEKARAAQCGLPSNQTKVVYS